MDIFEYGVLTLSFEQEETKINEELKNRCLEYAKSKLYQPAWVDSLRRFSWKEVLIAKSFDSSGKEKEILKNYTGKNEFTTVEYPRPDGCSEIIFSSRKIREDVWGSNYPVTVLARCLAKLGATGWEVVEYKFNTEGFGFAQALLKRKVIKKK
ncbi:MAG: hypothetical protein ABSE04_01495 [Candidatus Microgenomates bacterium]|jgi:hypothetical protein